MSAHEDETLEGWLSELAELTEIPPAPVVPPMRTFRVLLVNVIDATILRTLYIDAHSVTCEGDAAKFYVYRIDTSLGKGPMLAAYSTRSLRPYLDVEDVTAEVAATGKLLN